MYIYIYIYIYISIYMHTYVHNIYIFIYIKYIQLIPGTQCRPWSRAARRARASACPSCAPTSRRIGGSGSPSTSSPGGRVGGIRTGPPRDDVWARPGLAGPRPQRGGACIRVSIAGREESKDWRFGCPFDQFTCRGTIFFKARCPCTWTPAPSHLPI